MSASALEQAQPAGVVEMRLIVDGKRGGAPVIDNVRVCMRRLTGGGGGEGRDWDYGERLHWCTERAHMMSAVGRRRHCSGSAEVHPFGRAWDAVTSTMALMDHAVLVLQETVGGAASSTYEHSRWPRRRLAGRTGDA